jgi:hypothetical protein
LVGFLLVGFLLVGFLLVGFLLWVSRSQAMKGCLGGFADRGVVE